MGKYEEQIKEIEKEVGSTGGAYRTVKAALKSERIEIEQLKSKIKTIKNVLEQSIDNYEKAENQIRQSRESKKEAEQSNNKSSENKENNSESEYTYSEDNIAVPVEIKYLNKLICLEMAERIISEHGEDGKCNGMTKERIAKELYAHAVGYYAAESLKNIGIDGDFIQGVSESGKVADIGLGDGLDIHYNIIWYGTGGV